jgi:hypothetical protein
MSRTLLAPCALVLAGLASPLAAQGSQEQPRIHAVEWTFSGGYFHPTGTAGQTGTIGLTRRPAWVGASMVNLYAPGGKWGVQASAGYSPERIRQNTAGGSSAGSRGTNLLYANAQLLIGRSPRLSGISYMVGGGVGVMHRKKSVLDSGVGSTNGTGVASLMVRIPLDGQVGLRLDGQDMVYKADYGLGSKLRNDFILTAGLGVSW